MGRKQAFSDDLLLEAVIKYAEVYSGKIKYAQLAEWARKNISGLETVEDRHFSRPYTDVDKKTGKKTKKAKTCTERIEEINKSRDLRLQINSNKLLKSSNINDYFELPDSIKKQEIIETRKLVEEVTEKNIRLQRENDALKRINKEQTLNIDRINEQIKDVEKKERIISKKVNHLMNDYLQLKGKEVLEEVGIQDGINDLRKARDEMERGVKEIFNIRAELNKYVHKGIVETDRQSDLDEKELRADLMTGINFD